MVGVWGELCRSERIQAPGRSGFCEMNSVDSGSAEVSSWNSGSTEGRQELVGPKPKGLGGFCKGVQGIQAPLKGAKSS